MTRFNQVMVAAFKWIGASSIAVMMLLTCVDVIMRAVGHPLKGAVELTGYLATLGLACSLPYTHAMRGHVGVDMVVRKLPGRWQGRVDATTGLLSLALFAIIAWQSFAYALTLKNSGEVSMILGFPTYLLVLFIGFSFAALCLVLLQDMVESIKRAVEK